jgi:PPM family protein phosphatase
MKLNKHYFGQRNQGRRSYQEDDFGFDSSHNDDFLMVIADGMGGYEGGAVASERAIQAFMDNYYVASGDTGQRLQHSLTKANQQLALEKQSNPILKNMGCTLVAVAINAQSMEWISVGDSPLWLLREERLYRLNADHSVKPELQKQVDAGILTAEQMKTHPERNMLRSALIGYEIEFIDQAQISLHSNDKILLASDGILSLTTDEIKSILSTANNAKQAVTDLLNAVENKAIKNQDNTTALVVYVPNKQFFPLLDKLNKLDKHDWYSVILLTTLLAHLLLWIAVQIHWVKPLELLETVFPHPITEQQEQIRQVTPP